MLAVTRGCPRSENACFAELLLHRSRSLRLVALLGRLWVDGRTILLMQNRYY